MIRSSHQDTEKKKRTPGVMKWGDFLLIGITLTLCAVLWGKLIIGFTEKGQQVEIVANGQILLRYDLTTQTRNYISPGLNAQIGSFTAEPLQDGGFLLHMMSKEIHFDILLQNGQARFAKSDCPDQICVHTGFISKPGQVAACVPAQVLLRITGSSASGSEPDVTIK
jgi:hypothetical protein